MGRWLAVSSGFHFEVTSALPDGSLSGTIWLDMEESAANAFALSGRYDNNAKTWGFVVAWCNGLSEFNSTTSYVLSNLKVGEQRVMKCDWLKRDLATEATNWESTILGRNIFVHQCATTTPIFPCDHTCALAESGCSHPVDLTKKA